nr:unnamed protein product [Spirometra erinaceieuropaei]
MRTHLYSTIVDLTKALDTVNREGLWKIMLKLGCPERFIQMVRQLHEGMMARVTDNGAVSEEFAVTNGVKQGCVLAPTLFSLMFSAMLMDACLDERPGIRIAYRTDSHLLNRRRMHFRSRVCTITSVNFYSLTTAPSKPSRRVTCKEHDSLCRRQRKLWPSHHHGEDGFMHEPPPDAAYVSSHVNVHSAQIQDLDNSTYPPQHQNRR